MIGNLLDYDYTIKADGKYKLSDIIQDDVYEKWFKRDKSGRGKIFILNKGKCGNGGTMGFIRYARKNFLGLTVAVPNISIVQSKEKDSEICSVYGGKEVLNKFENIRVCTWDKHEEVMGYQQVGMDFDFHQWLGSLLVIDEYHKLVDDSSYRHICANIIHTVINTNNNVVLMSATPNYQLIEYLREVTNKDIDTYNVDYEDKEEKHLIYIERKDNSLTDTLITMVSKHKEKQMVIFLNNTKRIAEIVNQFEDVSDIEVLCSKNNKDKDIPAYSDNFNCEKHIHFLTSAYFTGMDIMCDIDMVVVIGSNRNHVTAYSAKEIKQMLGRMRYSYKQSFLLNDCNKIDVKAMADFSGKAEQIKSILGMIKDVKDKRDIHYISEYLKYLYYVQKIDSMNGWCSFDSMVKMIGKECSEYTVEMGCERRADKGKKVRNMSFKEYRRRRLNGEKLVGYQYHKCCEKFIVLYGLDEFAKRSRYDIQRMVKLSEKTNGVDVNSLKQEELYNLLLGDGYYSGSYLCGVLDFLGYEANLDNLEQMMMQVFGVYCFFESGDISRKSKSYFLCLGSNFYALSPETGYNCINIVNNICNQNWEKKRKTLISHRITPPKQKTQALTAELYNTNFISLTHHKESRISEFFTKIFSDPTIISGIKEDEGWGKVFVEYKKHQSLFSEFYKSNCNDRYPHKTESMDSIDCILIDIDNSIPFSQFKDIYSDYSYTAYPSISNTTEDWSKYRVIFYLWHTLKLSNENLFVLKIMRRMVCKYEDKQHQLGSYINAEQWAMRYENEGKPLDIRQDMVIYLENYIKTLSKYTYKKLSDKVGDWTLERCIYYYKTHDIDDHRHTALFVIKNNVKEADYEPFENWLITNHPDKLHHWRSHKIIRK